MIIRSSETPSRPLSRSPWREAFRSKHRTSTRLSRRFALMAMSIWRFSICRCRSQRLQRSADPSRPVSGFACRDRVRSRGRQAGASGTGLWRHRLHPQIHPARRHRRGACAASSPAMSISHPTWRRTTRRPGPMGRDEDAEIARRIATLTAQQLRVLEMLGTGKLNKEIAFRVEHRRDDGQGACLRDSPEAEGLQPHPGGRLRLPSAFRQLPERALKRHQRAYPVR